LFVRWQRSRVILDGNTRRRPYDTRSFISDGSNAFTGAAVTEAQIQAETAALYSNPATVNIVFGANSSLQNGAESLTIPYFQSYSNYVNVLSSNSLANPANSTLATAVANLPNGNGAANPRPVFSTPAQLLALGLNVSANIGVDGSGNLVAGGPFHGAIVIGTTADTNAVLHEIIEILGGGGQGSYVASASQNFCLTSNAHSNCYGVTDLYRYSAPHVASFTTAPNATAYFSVDGGLTNLANFNQNGLGDFGDFTTTPCLIQSW